MALLESLYDYYELMNSSSKGSFKLTNYGFSNKNAYIEIGINLDGEFLFAKVVDKKDLRTMIPVSIESQSRTSGIFAHPLFDNLQYLASDIVSYINKKNCNKKLYDDLSKGLYFKSYLEENEKWINFIRYNAKLIYDFDPFEALIYLEAINTYIRKKSILQDLIKEDVLHLDSDGFLSNYCNSKKSDLSLIISNVIKSLVRFRVLNNGSFIEVEKNISIQKSYGYYLNLANPIKDYDYITGKYMGITLKHQKCILNSSSPAKLISSNDERNFTFKGRFINPVEALSIGYEVSEKLHNSLRYLINSSGFYVFSKVFLIYSNKNYSFPNIFKDCYYIESSYGVCVESLYIDYINNKFIDFKDIRFNDFDSRIHLLALDSPTAGRISVNYYSEMLYENYILNIEKWFKNTSWEFLRIKNKNKNYIYKSPSIKEIIRSCCGERKQENLYKSTLERIFRSIGEDESISIDLLNMLYRNSTNPMLLDDLSWRRVLSTTCAFYKSFYSRKKNRDYTLNIDYENRNRDYLFGRLLAIINFFEEDFYNLQNKEVKFTIVKRNMQFFSKSPCRVWNMVYNQFLPYLNNYYKDLIRNVVLSFSSDDFYNNSPLNGEFLLGFYSQEYEMRNNK